MKDVVVVIGPGQIGQAVARRDDFARMNVGTVSPAEFLAWDNISAIMVAESARNDQ